MECKDTIISKTNFDLSHYYVFKFRILSHFSIDKVPYPPITRSVPAPKKRYFIRSRYGVDTKQTRNCPPFNSANKSNDYFSFNISRISVSSTSSLLGAGGAAGAAGASTFFFSVSLVSNLMNIKIEKAIIRKSKVTCKKLP